MCSPAAADWWTTSSATRSRATSSAGPRSSAAGPPISATCRRRSSCSGGRRAPRTCSASPWRRTRLLPGTDGTGSVAGLRARPASRGSRARFSSRSERRMASISTVTIVGAGRMGQGLALALRGVDLFLVSRRSHPVAAPLRLFPGARADALGGAGLVILAVPDDAITSVAADLAGEHSVRPDHAVLHLSGLLDRRALSPLAETGAALGSFHPLQTIADPVAAPE